MPAELSDKLTEAEAHALAARVASALERRNDITTAFFRYEAPRLAVACREMSDRFLRGGRLLAFGKGPYATDAQHVSVEFVHPVIVGKRALPALDISVNFADAVDALAGPDDIVMGFAPPGGDNDIDAALDVARTRGAMTFALVEPGNSPDGDARTHTVPSNDYRVQQVCSDPFIHQEVIEMLYHVLWESVHVFFEHAPIHQDAGAASFLYPFLGADSADPSALTASVAASILAKVDDDVTLRQRVAADASAQVASACVALHHCVTNGGTIITFGNGGSATDANDLAIDCVSPPPGYARIAAISLSGEPANVSAIANDVGADLIFLRQLIAQARTGDAVVAFSTSGGSRNVILALAEARRRGLVTVAILGYDGGEIRRQHLADHCIVVQSDYIPRIQEVQASIYHVMRDQLEAMRRAAH